MMSLKCIRFVESINLTDNMLTNNKLKSFGLVTRNYEFAYAICQSIAKMADLKELKIIMNGVCENFVKILSPALVNLEILLLGGSTYTAKMI